MLHQDPQIWIGTDAMLGNRPVYMPPPPPRPRWWQRFWAWLHLPVSHLFAALWRRD